MLNTNGKIGDILINAPSDFHFIAPDFLRVEIRKHYPKIIKVSKLNAEMVAEAEYRICKHIDFISEEQIKVAHWLAAEQLVADIDPKDVPYVAYSRHFRCKIWGGDKALMRGLEKKGFLNFISTNDLYELINNPQ